jgi:hypothetical protein
MIYIAAWKDVDNIVAFDAFVVIFVIPLVALLMSTPML